MKEIWNKKVVVTIKVFMKSIVMLEDDTFGQISSVLNRQIVVLIRFGF